MELLGIIPGLDESISDSECSSLISTEIVKIESGSCESILNMVHDLSLDGVDIISKVRIHQFPHFFSALLGIVIFELRSV